jgi:nucleotide-binding universal stress UspA family protein
MPSVRTILVPIDFSEASEAALRYAKMLAAALGASLHLVHVVEDLLAHAWAAELYVASMTDMRQEIEQEARQRLGAMFTDEERRTFQAETVLLSGNPFLEIIRYARAHDVDLIAMGTHGHGPIAHVLLGSVAEKVLRKSPCPVLIVRESQHKFEMP